MIKSCYVHIPFCKSICSYCDFCKNFYNHDIIMKYLGALEKEICDSYKNEELDTLYIGGGTPSCLNKEELEKLFDTLKIFKLSDSYEFTFECNYEDITKELLSFLKLNRVNRISIGIETFNLKYKDILNRKIDEESMIEVINLTKKYFDNINIDLMYALPNETLDDVKNDLDKYLKLDVNHISTYSLIIEKHTKLGMLNKEEVSDDLQSDMYYYILNILKDNGYQHYELSNFSKKGYESKHNLTYWNNEPYYGFGAGASGFINSKRYDNTKSIINYINGVRMVYEETLDKEQMIKDEVMLNLRKIDGINKKVFKDKYNLSVSDTFDYKLLVNNGYLTETPDNILIPKDKLFISNEIIIMLLDAYILN